MYRRTMLKTSLYVAVYLCAEFLTLPLFAAATSFFHPYHFHDRLSDATIGNFRIQWDQVDPYLLIHHVDDPSHILFQTSPSWPFITIGYATDANPPIVDGNYKVDEWTLFETPYQSITKVSIQDDMLIIAGDIWGMVTFAQYQLRFYIPTDDVDTQSRSSTRFLENQLAFNLTVESQQGTFNRIFLNYWCDPKEKFYGFGVQYSLWNLKGRRVPILVAEQGIGRGAQPLTSFLNFFADRAGGDWSTTYAPKPLYLTNFHRSMILENSEMSFFDLRDDDSVVIETWSDSMQGRILYGTSVLSLITEITAYTGRMQPVPSWTQNGAILGLQGGSAQVLSILRYMQDYTSTSLTPSFLRSRPNNDNTAYHSDITDSNYSISDDDSIDYNDVKIPKVPAKIAGVWIQDWVGLRHAFDGDRLQWNWQLNRQHYPGYESLVSELQTQDIRILTYINPFFSPPVTDQDDYFHPNNHKSTNGSGNTDKVYPKRRNLYAEGVEHRYFVQNTHHQPYVLHSGSIEFCMIDFTNPQARQWFIDIMLDDMIDQAHSSGWMADFAEYLPFDAVLYDNQTSAASYHNLYPQAWAQLNDEVRVLYNTRRRQQQQQQQQHLLATKHVSTTSEVTKVKSSNNDDFNILGKDGHNNHENSDENDLYYFLRSAWLQSPRYTNGFWLGDQLVSWDAHDGLQSSLAGFLSGGLSGHSASHTDIGGYTMQDKGPILYLRSEELLLRWIEYASFGQQVFRSHMGLRLMQQEEDNNNNNDLKKPRNYHIFSSPRIIAHFNLFATIFGSLASYCKALMVEAREKGWPLIRPMIAHYPLIHTDSNKNTDHNCSNVNNIAEDTDNCDDTYEQEVQAEKDLLWSLTKQYMFGADFLVAPVLDSGAQSLEKRPHPQQVRNSVYFQELPVITVKVYLPAETTWVHLWSGQTVQASVCSRAHNSSGSNSHHSSSNASTDCHSGTGGRDKGRFVAVDAPIGAIPVFFRPESAHGWALRREIVRLGMQVSVSIQPESPQQYGSGDNAGSDSGEKRKHEDSESGKSGVWGGTMGPIRDHVARDWYDWLGIKEYLENSPPSFTSS